MKVTQIEGRKGGSRWHVALDWQGPGTYVLEGPGRITDLGFCGNESQVSAQVAECIACGISGDIAKRAEGEDHE